MTFGPLKPNTWPQDSLEIPAGMGGMPPMERGNATRSRAEYAVYSTLFLLPLSLAQFTTQTVTLLTDQDGDFWCDQIAVQSFQYVNALQGGLITPSAYMGVKDIRTGRDLFYSNGVNVNVNPTPFSTPQIPANTMPIAMFRKSPDLGSLGPMNYDGTNPLPQEFRDTGTLIQPFCFTRQGGIQVSLTNPYPIPANIRYEISVMFSGWKEYANASA
jgi:hypothetical protein